MTAPNYMGRQKVREEGVCRVCGYSAIDPHHIVYKSLGGDDWPLNICPLCRECHDAVHAKKIDLLSVLDLKEQGYAASLIGIEAAHRLLAPSVYRVTV